MKKLSGSFALSFLLFLGGGLILPNAVAENFNGIEIDFDYPYLVEKQSFRLRGVISKEETIILKEAMPTIAELLNFIRLDRTKNYAEKTRDSSIRSPMQFIKNPGYIGFGAYTTHKWKISETEIRFACDYLVWKGSSLTESKIHPHLFRDTYVYKKIDDKWLFSGHFDEMPIGFLKCIVSNKNCLEDGDPW